jgi:hypothetical protein
MCCSLHTFNKEKQDGPLYCCQYDIERAIDKWIHGEDSYFAPRFPCTVAFYKIKIMELERKVGTDAV